MIQVCRGYDFRQPGSRPCELYVMIGYYIWYQLNERIMIFQLNRLAPLLVSVLLLAGLDVKSQDTLHFYLDDFDKPMSKKFASKRMDVFKEHPGDELYRVERYILDPYKLDAVCYSIDSKGEYFHGQYTAYYLNGAKLDSGNYIKGKKEGEWISWQTYGKPKSIQHYKEGKMIGTNLVWNREGDIIDSTMLDENGDGISTEYFPSGRIMAKGNFKSGQRTGNWTFYYPEKPQLKSMEATFEDGVLVTGTCYTEAGTVDTVDCVLEKKAEFPGGSAAWKNYLAEKISNMDFRKYMKGIAKYTAIVSFRISRNGTVSELKVEHPDNSELDKLALKVIAGSPAWLPARKYNRKVSSNKSQPITFVIDD